MAVKFNQVFGTSGNDELITNESVQEMVFLLKGDDTVQCDFKTIDYIVDSGGNDVLITGGAFADFSITPHLGIKGAYIVRSLIEGGKANIVKGIEVFRFNEGDASLQDFIDHIAPKPDPQQNFDKIIDLDKFINDQYSAEDGVSEQFLIDLNLWDNKPVLEINGFNADEDQVVIVTDIYSTAQQFVDDNISGGSEGTWLVQGGDIHLYNPNLSELALIAISGVNGNKTIFDAESEGWLKFGEPGPIDPNPEPEAVQINLSHFVNSSFTALPEAIEVITIPLSEWNENLNINGFNADQDKLIIDSAGQYTSAQGFIDANITGSNGTWVHKVDGAHLFEPINFYQIILSGIINANDKPNLIQAEAQGWIQFV